MKISEKMKIYLAIGLILWFGIQPYHIINLNTPTWHHSSGSMFEIDFQTGQSFLRFKLNFRILKLCLRFQIIQTDFQEIEVLGISHSHEIESLKN